MGSGQVTSADVARAAGVSRTTVSYVLNGTAQLPDATRKRVLEAAARLGYAPSAAARILRRGRSDLVVLVLPDWPIGYAPGRMIDLLSKGFAQHGLPMVTYQMSSSPDQWTRLWTSLTPAAVVALNAFDPTEEDAMRSAGITTAIALYPEQSSGMLAHHDSAVMVGRLQVEYLASKGHRRIAYARSSNPRLNWYADYRLEGVRLACADLGLDDPVVQVVGTDLERAVDAVTAWHRQDPPITAVAAYNDEVAMAVLAGIRDNGLTVPADLAVIGVDNLPVAALTRPALTTIDIASDALAHALVRKTLAALNDLSEPPDRTTAKNTLRVVARESV